MRSTATVTVSASQRKLAIYLMFRDLGITHQGAMFLMHRVPITDVIVDDQEETPPKRRRASYAVRFAAFIAIVVLWATVDTYIVSGWHTPVVQLGLFVVSFVIGLAAARWLLIR